MPSANRALYPTNKRLGLLNPETVEDVYPLSPIQEAFLFHTLSSPARDLYVQQVSAVLDCRTNISRLEEAWRIIVERHPILRTEFAWKGLSNPVQVVRKHVDLHIVEHDLRNRAPDNLNGQLESLFHDHSAGCIDPEEPPLFKLHLFRLDQETYLTFRFYHGILDGWSIPLLLQDVVIAYNSLRENKCVDLPSRRPFRDYIHWISNQNREVAERFWRARLNRTEPFSILRAMGRSLPTVSTADAVITASLSPHATNEVLLFARARRLTMATMLIAAWALTLHQVTRATDLVVGVTVSGRTPELRGIESMIGVFINTLPLATPIIADQFVWDFLKHLQEQQIAIRKHEHVSLGDIQAWSGLRKRSQLFDTIVVVENYPIDQAVKSQAADIALATSGAQERIHFPLSIVAGMSGQELKLRLLYDAHLFDSSEANRFISHMLTAILACVRATRYCRLSDLTGEDIGAIAF